MKFNKLIPEMYVSNILRSINFYKKLCFKVEYERKENKFAFLSLEGSQIMIQEKQEEDDWVTGKLEYPFGRGINFQIEVKNIEDIFEKAKEAYNIKIELQENKYQVKNKEVICKEFLIQDPDGYLLRFSQELKLTTPD